MDTLSDRKKLLVILLIILAFAGIYFYMFNDAGESGNSGSNNDTSSAYFIPPKDTSKEVKLEGKIVALRTDEIKENATHKIIDDSGNILVYAYASDDKLRQQEGTRVTVAGTVPISVDIKPDYVLKVDYISFK